MAEEVVVAPPTRWSDLWRSEDWWAIWLGGLLLIVSVASVYFARPAEFDSQAAAAAKESDVPKLRSPLKAWLSRPGAKKSDDKSATWQNDPRQALWMPGEYDHRVGTLVALGTLGVLFAIALGVMNQRAVRFIPAYIVVALLAALAFTMAAQRVVSAYNFEYVLWALLLGLVISNTVGTPSWLRPAVRTEMYIKTGLVLLGAEILFDRLLKLGYPGIFIAWVTTPIVLISTYMFGQRVLRMESKSLNMTICADMSVCGVSAAIATAAACRAKKEELSLAVGLSLAFTAVMMIVLPKFIQVVGMDPIIGGAWIGGTIDSTGAVAAAGAFLGDEAKNVAVLVKMIQNILIGVVAFGVAVYWVSVVDRSADKDVRPSVWEIWYRFPKFVLGFLVASLICTWLGAMLPGGKAVIDAAISGSTKTWQGWCFCLAFVSIGLETDFRRLAHYFRGGKPLVLYMVGQSLNLAMTLFMAWLMFRIVFPNAAPTP